MRKLLLIIYLGIVLQSVGQTPMRMLIPKAVSITYDTDAQNYITRVEAGGRTLTTAEKGYINTLVLAQKASGVWAKMYDCGLPIWGNATSNAETLKGVNDVTWSGTITHGANYVQSGGGWGNTGIVPSTHLSANNVMVGVYMITDANVTNGVALGASDGTNGTRLNIFPRTSGSFILDLYGTNTRILQANANSLGYHAGTRISSTDLRMYKNGSQVGSTNTTANTGTFTSQPLYFMAFNGNGVGSAATTQRFTMWIVSAGLTAGEIAQDNADVEAFMDSMGIGVQ